jgi:sulfate permease, SulP family
VLLGSFEGFRTTWVRGDLVAGLTVWAVLVPESLAYATIAGVPPVVGLYAAVPALVLYALLGSSRHLVVGPMSATAALSAGTIATFAHGTADYVALTTALAVVTGVVALAAGLLRLGFLASLISEPVLKGFIIGLALTILVGQLPKMFGVSSGDGNFFQKTWDLMTKLGDAKPLELAVGFGSLALLWGLRRWAPKVPASLVVVLLSIAVTTVLDLGAHGLDLVGTIASGLPSLGLPDLNGHRYLDLVGPAAGIMLVGFAEGLGAAKTYAARAGYDVDSNRELIGLGGANLGAGLCSGMVVNGSLSKTAVNGGAGARSQLSGLTAAAVTVVTLLFLTGLFEKLPEATLAAVVIMAVVELIDVASLKRLYRVQTGRLAGIYGYTSRADFLAAVAALLGVLLFDTLPGLVIGIVVSLVLLVARTSRPHVAVLGRMPGEHALWVEAEQHDEADRPGDLLVLRVEGQLFFGNADYVRDRVRALVEDGTRAVVIDGETSPSLDITAVEMLVELTSDLDRAGVGLALAHPIGQVRDVLAQAEVAGEPDVYPTLDDAVTALSSGGVPPRGPGADTDPR